MTENSYSQLQNTLKNSIYHNSTIHQTKFTHHKTKNAVLQILHLNNKIAHMLV